MDSSPTESKHIPALDGLRGAAILAVIGYHCLNWAGPNETHPADRAVKSVMGAGWAGVDLFFVLSGFLITGILLGAKGNPHYLRNFFVRRSLRIFPLYVAFIAIRLVAVPLSARPPDWLPWHQSLAAVTYMTNVWQCVFPEAMRGEDALHPTWSLCIEEQFYLVWPFVVLACRPRWLLRLSGVAIVGAIATRVAIMLHGADPWAAYVLLPCRIDALALGGVLAVLARRDGLEPLYRTARLLAPTSLATLIGVAVAQGSSAHAHPLMATVGYTAVDLLCVAILVLASAGPAGSWVRRAAEWGPLRAAGKYSYAAYLFHAPIGWYMGYILFLRTRALAPLRDWTHHIGSNLPLYVASTACVIAVTFVAAWVSWHLYEKRWLRLKRYFPSGGLTPRERQGEPQAAN